MSVDLPELEKLDWLTVRRPISQLALPLVVNLGPGETQSKIERKYKSSSDKFLSDDLSA